MRVFVDITDSLRIDVAEVEAVKEYRNCENPINTYCAIWMKSGNRYDVYLPKNEVVERLGLYY